MNRRQKALLREATIILVITVLTMVAIMNLKDWLNRREALLAMEALGQQLITQRENTGMIPPRDYVDQVLDSIPGRARLMPGLHYRAQWIGIDATPETVLAYTPKHFRSLVVESGYVVLFLNGDVQWLTDAAFNATLTPQLSQDEQTALIIQP